MGLTQSIPNEQGFKAMEAGMAMTWGEEKGNFILPYFLGGYFNFIMFGVVMTQFIRWVTYTRRNAERGFVIVTVGMAMCAAIASVIYCLSWLLDIFVWHFGEYKTFSQSKWPGGYAMIDNVMTLSVQAFYADRAYRLNSNKVIVLFMIIPTMIISTGGAIGMYCQWYMRPWGGKVLFEDPHILLAFYLWAFGVLSTDLGITLTMAYGLNKSKTGWKRTDKMLSRLIMLSLETQLPALISAVFLAITYTMKQTTTLGIFFLMSHTHIYMIGLLAMLNYRITLRGVLSGPESTSYSGPSFSGASAVGGRTGPVRSGGGVGSSGTIRGDILLENGMSKGVGMDEKSMISPNINEHRPIPSQVGLHDDLRIPTSASLSSLSTNTHQHHQPPPIIQPPMMVMNQQNNNLDKSVDTGFLQDHEIEQYERETEGGRRISEDSTHPFARV